MKKLIIFGISCAATLLFTSCSQELLDIQQKGVVSYEDFYKTDEDAESATLAIYAEAIRLDCVQGKNNPTWNAVTKAGGDELYWGGGKKESDDVSGQEINEFRHTFDNTNGHIKYAYKELYALIYKCNLVLDNFYGEDGSLCDTDVKKQCVAEARAWRAWAHFYLAIMFYNPPLVDHVLAGDARPVNSDHDELLKWVVSEFQKAESDLPERQGQNDRQGAVRFTKGACQAFLGRAQLFVKDYAGAKTTLKKVIDSGNYALTPTANITDIFHRAGDGNCEKVLEFNVVDNENMSSYYKYHTQRNNALFFRQMKNFPDFTIQVVGWGNNVGPTEKFVKAMLENEAGSARQKAWFCSYEELLTDFSYSKLDYNSDGSEKTKDEKLMDANRGLDLKKYAELYNNCGYFWIKFLPYQSDLIKNSTTVTDENRILMRYAEVLLLYAEACAQTGDNDGLKYLNMVQERAGAPLSASLTMDAVKKEKWFELAWEGQRFWDLVRWGDAEKELAFKSNDLSPYLADDFYVYNSQGKKQTGRPHKAVINYKDDGWAAKGGGFKTGKHEYYPIPFSVLETNDALQQNPYWAE